MTNIPENLKYTKEHEWADLSSENIAIGITDFAQSSLGDIVYLELPEVGTILKQNDPFGVVESIKSVSDLYAPVSGEVIAVNEALSDTPESLNTNPYDSWLLKIKPNNDSEIKELLDFNAYRELCAEN
jgi:glycine cleavage system H protein